MTIPAGPVRTLTARLSDRQTLTTTPTLRIRDGRAATPPTRRPGVPRTRRTAKLLTEPERA